MTYRWAVPGYPYRIGEVLAYVVDPFWERHRKIRQCQNGVVVSFDDKNVLVNPIGEPWDEPKPTAEQLRS